MEKMKRFYSKFIIPIAVTVVAGLILAKIQDINIWKFITNQSMIIFDFIKNIIFFKIPIWSILILGLFTFLLNKKFFKQKKYITLSKNYLDVFNKMSQNEQEVLKAIILLHELNKERTLDNILKIIKNEIIFKVKLTRLEIIQVTKNLEEKGILSSIFSIFDSYDLSNYGKDIAVALIQYSKKMENEPSTKAINNDL